MKKSTIAISAFAVLIGTWLSGTWYSGKLIAEKYTHYIEEANKNIAQFNNTMQYKIVLKNNKYERHFFDTETEDTITITDTESDTSYVIPFKTKLEHGPFPISRLLSLKWLPVMVSGTYEISKDPSLETVFAATNQQTPLKSAFSVSYNEKITQTIDVAGFNYESAEENIQFHSAPFSISSNTNLQGIGQIDAAIPSIQFKIPSDGEATDNTLNVNGITLKIDQTPTEYPHLDSGTQYVKIDTFQISNDETVVTLKGITSDATLGLNNSMADMTSKFAVDEIILQEQNFGKFILDIAFNHIDAKPLSQLLGSIQNLPLIDNPSDKLTEQQAQWGKEIITNEPEFVIKQLSLTNSTGENKLTTNVKLANLTNVDPEQLITQGDPLAVFQQIEIRSNLNKPALIDTLISIYQSMHNSNLPSEEAKQQAQTFVEERLNVATSNNQLVTKDNITYTQDIILENSELKMNGEIIPKEQIAQQLLLFFMTFMQ